MSRSGWGALADLVHSKELLRRDKDVERLALLYEQRPELARPPLNIDVEDGVGHRPHPVGSRRPFGR